MALKVKPAVKPPEMQKVTFSLPVTTVQLVRAYGEAYKQEYGQEADEDYLLNGIISEFLGSDKDFQAFLAKHPDLAKDIKAPAKRGRKPRQKKEEPEESTT